MSPATDDRLARLVRLEERLTALLALLAEERRAVATLDTTALVHLASEKDRLAEELRSAIADAAGLKAGLLGVPGATDQMASIARRMSALRAHAAANAALLTEAYAAVNQLAGRDDPGLYDARARRRYAPPPRATTI